MNRLSFLLALVMGLSLPTNSSADDTCGPAPEAQFRGEKNEEIVGDLKGKAQLLTRFVGDAELGGQIKLSRNEVYATYPDADKARTNAYFLYLFCKVLFEPGNQQSTQQKLDAIGEFQKQISGRPDAHHGEFRRYSISYPATECDAKPGLYWRGSAGYEYRGLHAFEHSRSNGVRWKSDTKNQTADLLVCNYGPFSQPIEAASIALTVRDLSWSPTPHSAVVLRVMTFPINAFPDPAVVEDVPRGSLLDVSLQAPSGPFLKLYTIPIPNDVRGLTVVLMFIDAWGQTTQGNSVAVDIGSIDLKILNAPRDAVQRDAAAVEPQLVSVTPGGFWRRTWALRPYSRGAVARS